MLATSEERFSSGLCTLMLLSCTLLQKFAIPGTRGALALNLLVMYLLAATAFFRGILFVDLRCVAILFCFLAATAVSFFVSDSASLSLHSWLLVMSVQVSFVFVIKPGLLDYDRLIGFFLELGFILALVGIVQFLLQFVAGAPVAFFLDHNLPEGIKIAGYNNLNPVHYLSPVFKSNGVVFAEPAFFSQFIAIALLAELHYRGRIVRLVIFAIAMICSFSGTGMLTVALFAPLLAVSRLPSALVAIVIAAGSGAVLSNYVEVGRIWERLSEFESSRSSGFARLFSMFYNLREFILTDVVTFFFGRGAGSVREFWHLVDYESFDPTWGKVIYEYGMIGFCFYLALLWYSLAWQRSIAFPLVFTFLVLGGYLVDASVAMQLLALLGWTRTPRISLLSDLATDRLRRV